MVAGMTLRQIQRNRLFDELDVAREEFKNPYLSVMERDDLARKCHKLEQEILRS